MSPVAAPPLDPAVTATVARLFEGEAGTVLPTVGVELELIPFRRSPAGGRPQIPCLAETADALAGLAHVTFEPGGQFEFSPPPSSTATGAVTAMAALVQEASRRLRRQGIECLAAGVEPWHAAGEVALQLHSDRYVAMDAYYARCGGTGRAFMRQTASTQVCVGLRPGPAGASQWRAANLLAPLLAAAFANAPVRKNRRVGHNGSRTDICRRADPDRHHLAAATSGDDPVVTYSRFALGAQPIGAAYAGLDNLAGHLTTLFPPVRPRGTYLEIRSIDALAGDDVATAIVLGAALLSTPDVVSATVDRLAAAAGLDPDDRWDLACGPGVRDPELRAETLAVVDLALGTLDRLVPCAYLPPNSRALLLRLRARVRNGRAPGDG